MSRQPKLPTLLTSSSSSLWPTATVGAFPCVKFVRLAARCWYHLVRNALDQVRVTETTGDEEILRLRSGPQLSAAQEQLVLRASVLGTLLENCEARLLLGQQVQLSEYLEMANTQKRMLAALGLERVARDVTPSLADIMREHQREVEHD